MINRLLPKNRELEYAMKKRKECQEEFKDTAKKANGYLKSKVEEAHPAFDNKPSS